MHCRRQPTSFRFFPYPVGHSSIADNNPMDVAMVLELLGSRENSREILRRAGISGDHHAKTFRQGNRYRLARQWTIELLRPAREVEYSFPLPTHRLNRSH